jgi:hypothetical protein
MMLSYLADEDFSGRIVRGQLLRDFRIDLVCVQDVGLSGADDVRILQWAANNRRVTLTHDIRTMPVHAKNLIARGDHPAGVFIVDDHASIGWCIEDLLLIAECCELGEWQDQLLYLPMK